jgi:hypothetical protein
MKSFAIHIDWLRKRWHFLSLLPRTRAWTSQKEAFATGSNFSKDHRLHKFEKTPQIDRQAEAFRKAAWRSGRP